jgi:hypothetical protein
MLVKIALFVTCLEKIYSSEHLCLRSFRLKIFENLIILIKKKATLVQKITRSKWLG